MLLRGLAKRRKLLFACVATVVTLVAIAIITSLLTTSSKRSESSSSGQGNSSNVGGSAGIDVSPSAAPSHEVDKVVPRRTTSPSFAPTTDSPSFVPSLAPTEGNTTTVFCVIADVPYSYVTVATLIVVSAFTASRSHDLSTYFNTVMNTPFSSKST